MSNACVFASFRNYALAEILRFCKALANFRANSEIWFAVFSNLSQFMV